MWELSREDHLFTHRAPSLRRIGQSVTHDPVCGDCQTSGHNGVGLLFLKFSHEANDTWIYWYSLGSLLKSWCVIWQASSCDSSPMIDFRYVTNLSKIFPHRKIRPYTNILNQLFPSELNQIHWQKNLTYCTLLLDYLSHVCFYDWKSRCYLPFHDILTFAFTSYMLRATPIVGARSWREEQGAS